MFRKRSLNEIADAINNGDYTGGYNYINWTVFMPEGRDKGILSHLVLILGIIILATIGGTYNFKIQLIVGILFILGGIFLHLWTYREFKRLKKGISD